MSQHDVARLLQCSREDGVLIARGLEVSNLFQERPRCPRPDFRLEFPQGFEARVALRSGESGVEGDYANTSVREALDQPGVRFSRQGERSQLLKGPLVNTDDHDAIIVRPRTAKGETKIEGTKLDILEKQEPGATIAADTRESKEEQARERHEYSQGKIHLAGRDSTQPGRPSPFGLRCHPGLVERKLTTLNIVNCTDSWGRPRGSPFAAALVVRSWFRDPRRRLNRRPLLRKRPAAPPSARNWSTRPSQAKEAGSERRWIPYLRAAYRLASAATGSRPEAIRW